MPGSDAPRRAVFHPEAAAEFDEAMAYYEHEAPAVVDAFESEVMRTVVFIEQFPEAAPIDRGNVRCKLITRFKNEVYYAVEPDRLRSWPCAMRSAGPGTG